MHNVISKQYSGELRCIVLIFVEVESEVVFTGEGFAVEGLGNALL